MKHISELSIDSVVEKMGEYKSYQDFAADTLYHGTCEDIVGALCGGAYDGVLWTASSPDIAQTYIPESGGVTYWSKPKEWEMEEPIRIRHSRELVVEIAKQMGYDFDIEYDEFGRVRAYGASKCGEQTSLPTNAEIWNYLSLTLGYRENGDGFIDLKCESTGDGPRYLPANHRLPGKLYVISGAAKLRFANISKGESDLTDLQYHRLELFDRLAGEGYDGVIIDDFCQTKIFGNVGHRSYGIFPEGLKKLECRSVFATHHEWDLEYGPGGSRATADFDPKGLFAFAQNKKDDLDFFCAKSCQEDSYARTVRPA